MSGKRLEPELIKTLKSGDPGSRSQAAMELAFTGTEASIPLLREAMRTGDQVLRLACGFALWRIASDKEGLDTIIGSLTSDSPDAREGAVYALGALGKAVIPFLEEILKAQPERREIRRILDELRETARGNP